MSSLPLSIFCFSVYNLTARLWLSKSNRILSDNGCEAHEIEEETSKYDIKEVVIDDTAKAIGQRHMEYSMLALETWAVATETQHETQETEDANKGKVIVSVHDKNGEQSTTKDDEGQAGQEDLKVFLGMRSRHLTTRTIASRLSSLM